MLLYHGTSSRHLESIKKDGLLPRGRARGNWRHNDMDSRAKSVYLTTLYAAYFALVAADQEDELPMIVVVDTDLLDTSKLHADEDFLAQTTREEGTVRALTKYYRKICTNYCWEPSIEHLGTCGHDGKISPEAIVGHVIWDPDKQKRMTWEAMDPTITVLNKRFVGTKYESLVEWLVNGHCQDRDDIFGVRWTPPETDEGIERVRW